MARLLARICARAVHLTGLVDRAYRRFTVLRSTSVLAFATPQFFEEYNDVTYPAERSFRPDARASRRGLFAWEEAAIARSFPSPPSRLLVGGAGGGREALVLLERGYAVVAFDPAEGLIDALIARAGDAPGLRAYYGSYGSLPLLREPHTGAAVDLTSERPFDGAIIGWASLSHLHTDSERVATLIAFSRVTKGPILVSYYPKTSGAAAVDHHGPLQRWVSAGTARHGRTAFSVSIGGYRVFSHPEVLDLAARSGLQVLHSEEHGNWPYLVLEGSGVR